MMRALALWLFAALRPSVKTFREESVEPRAKAVSYSLERVTDAAETFFLEAGKFSGIETFRQRAVVYHRKFGRSPEGSIQSREIVSEYGFATLKDSPQVIHEFRNVISVDGRPVTSAAKARETLMSGIVSKDDRLLRQMLRDFAGYGLEGAIVDFGQILLQFRRSNVAGFEFSVSGFSRLGPDSAIRLAFHQRDESAGQHLTVFEGHKAIHRSLEGELWVRETDSLPLRVIVTSVRRTDRVTEVRDSTTVDYGENSTGVLLPAAVVHRQWINGEVQIEDILQYSNFRKFAAEAVIHYDDEKPATPKP